MQNNRFKGLMEGVAGIRGVIGSGLTPDLACKYAAAYGSMMGGGEIVVGGDGRISGKMVCDAVCAGLQAVGCLILDVGVAPTPTIQVILGKRGSRGGIAVTASHNPQEWNALKFFAPSSLFLDEDEGRELKRILLENDINYVPYDRLGKIQTYDKAVEDHIKAILDMPYLNLSAIRRKDFKVALDCVNASGSRIMPQLLTELGCSVNKVHCEYTGIFPRPAEPLAENLKDLCQLVVETQSDVGFALDPDGDRLAIVDETGSPLGEEYTLTIAVDFILRHKKGPVVANVSTTRALDDLAKAYSVELHRSKVGEVHVAKKMAAVGAVIGGEGNGGVILPEVHLGRDAPVGAALTLQYMAESDLPLSKIAAKLPQYKMVKDRISIEGLNKEEIFARIESKAKEAKIDRTDGLKIIHPRCWAQIRPSNTEPILRIFAEASNKTDAERLVNDIKKIVFNQENERE